MDVMSWFFSQRRLLFRIMDGDDEEDQNEVAVMEETGEVRLYFCKSINVFFVLRYRGIGGCFNNLLVCGAKGLRHVFFNLF